MMKSGFVVFLTASELLNVICGKCYLLLVTKIYVYLNLQTSYPFEFKPIGFPSLQPIPLNIAVPNADIGMFS